MNSIRKISYLLLLWVLVLPPPAKAHDPGMSHASIHLHSQEIMIKMAFVREDMETLVPLDTNHDGSVDAAEFSMASEQLQAHLSHAVIVSEGLEPIPPAGVWVELEQDDSVTVGLVYSNGGNDDIYLEFPLLDMLARGHRQYLTVFRANGELVDRHMVSSATKPIILHRL